MAVTRVGDVVKSKKYKERLQIKLDKAEEIKVAAIDKIEKEKSKNVVNAEEIAKKRKIKNKKKEMVRIKAKKESSKGDN